MRKCPKCNYTIKNDKMKFCPKCGENLTFIIETTEKNKINNNDNIIIYILISVIVIALFGLVISKVILNDDKKNNDTGKTNDSLNIVNNENTSTGYSSVDDFINGIFYSKNYNIEYFTSFVPGVDDKDNIEIYILSQSDENVSFKLVFDKSQTLLNMMITYENTEDNIVEDVEKFLLDDIFDMSEKEKKNLKKLINLNSSSEDKKYGNLLIRKGSSNTLIVTVDDSSNFKDYKLISFTLEYNKKGEYGKISEYEGNQEILYYFPKGNYIITLDKHNDKYCFLWIDYNKAEKNEFGTTYNNKQKLSFNENNKTHTISLTSDTHIYNSNDCNYNLIKTS